MFVSARLIFLKGVIRVHFFESSTLFLSKSKVRVLHPIWQLNVMIRNSTNDFKKYNGLEVTFKLSFI